MQSGRADQTSADGISVAEETNETAIYEELFQAFREERHDDVRKLYRRLLQLGRSQVEVESKVHSVLFEPPPPGPMYVNGPAPVRPDARRGKARRKPTREVSSRRRASPRGTRQSTAKAEAPSLNENDAEASIETSLDDDTLSVETATPANAVDSNLEFGPPQTKSTVDALPPLAPGSTISDANAKNTEDQGKGQSGLPSEAANPSPSRLRSLIMLVGRSPAFAASISGLAVLVVAGALILELHGPGWRPSFFRPPDRDTSVVTGKPPTNTASDAPANATEPPATKANDHPVGEVREAASAGKPPRPPGDTNVVPPTKVSGDPPITAAGSPTNAAEPPATKANDGPVGEVRETVPAGNPPRSPVDSNVVAPTKMSGGPPPTAAGSPTNATEPPATKANDRPVGEVREAPSTENPTLSPRAVDVVAPTKVSGDPPITAAGSPTNATKPPATKASDHPVGEVREAPSTENPTLAPRAVDVVAPTKMSGDPPLDGPQGFPTGKQGERQSSLPAPASTSAPVPAAATSAPVPAAAIEKAPPGGTLSEAEISALVQRGDSLFAQGDVASARLFYKRAAIAGNGKAALRLGNSFDSVFLNRVGMGGVHGDVSLATRWYYRALELGEDDAAVLLTALAKKNEN
jgi:hypothetical protein